MLSSSDWLPGLRTSASLDVEAAFDPSLQLLRVKRNQSLFGREPNDPSLERFPLLQRRSSRGLCWVSFAFSCHHRFCISRILRWHSRFGLCRLGKLARGGRISSGPSFDGYQHHFEGTSSQLAASLADGATEDGPVGLYRVLLRC